MPFHFLADIVVLIHLIYILFVVFGGFLVLEWKRLVWIHIPAVVWAVLIEFANWYCPLTPLENWLREIGGRSGYQSGFIEHYILPLIYPTILTRALQIILGIFVGAVNLGIYGWIMYRTIKIKTERNAS